MCACRRRRIRNWTFNWNCAAVHEIQVSGLLFPGFSVFNGIRRTVPCIAGRFVNLSEVLASALGTCPARQLRNHRSIGFALFAQRTFDCYRTLHRHSIGPCSRDDVVLVWVLVVRTELVVKAQSGARELTNYWGLTFRIRSCRERKINDQFPGTK